MTSLGLAQLAWIAGFLLLGGLAVTLARRSRAEPNAAVGRGIVLACFALVALLALGGAHAWGVLVASQGMERIQREHGARGGGGGGEGSPARARLFLRAAQLVLTPRPGPKGAPEGGWRGTVGFSPDAALLLPRDYGLAEAHSGRDLLEVEAQGRVGLAVKPLDAASDTRIILYADRTAQPGEPSPPPDPLLGDLQRRLLPGHRCPASPAAAAPAEGASVVYAFLCKGAQPRAALVFRRDVPHADETFAQGAPVRVEPYVWRGGLFKPHQLEIGRGDLLQMGAMADAVPGVKVWEVPAPAGRASLLFPPKDLLSTCAGWLGDTAEAGFYFYRRGIGPIEGVEQTEDPDSFVCVLRFDATIPFLLEVRRLVPDVGGVYARSIWAGLLIAAPVLLLLAGLLIRPLGGRPASAVSAVAALSVASTFLAALLPWRLLWAHRLDMLRAFEAVGERVRLNEVLVVLIAASLAGTAAVLWPWRRQGTWRLFPAAGAWLAMCVLGGYAVVLAAARPSFGQVFPQVVFSFALATALVWWPRLLALLGRPQRGATRALVPAALLAGLGLAGLLGRAVTPGAVHAKLLGAWAFVPIAYAALRAAVGGGPRDWAAVVAGVLIGFAGLAVFDTGVTLAVAAPGLLFALAATAHDATHAEADSSLIDNYRRHLRPLVLGEALVAVAVACVLLFASGRTLAPRLPQRLTWGALYLPVLAALLFALGAFLVGRRHDLKKALPWIAAAVLGLGLFFARSALVERSIQSDSQTSKRVAALLDPAYALLRDDLTFARTLTAWREASLGASTGASQVPAPLVAEGQGYFGAQVVDPGVLLSVENDYLPVLLLRETGARGLFRLVLLFGVLVVVMWLVVDRRFPVGSAAARARRIAALVLGSVVLYQPVASLGVLPFTGISWPGLGIDSPSDLWVFAALVLAILLWREEDRVPNVHEERLRATRPFRRAAALGAVAAAALTVSGAVFVLGAGRFAATRPAPVTVEAAGDALPKGRRRAHLAEPFSGLAEALDYVEHLNLERRAGAVLPALITQSPRSATLRAFDGDLRAAWEGELAQAAGVAARFQAGAPCLLERGTGHFSAAPAPDDPAVCVLRFRFGWPALVLRVPRPPGQVAWKLELADEAFRALRYPAPRRDPNARFRLKSHAMGTAARDRAELLSGAVVLRMREEAGELDLRTATGGLFAAERARLSEDIEVLVEAKGVAVARVAPGKVAPRLFTSRVPEAAGAPRLHELEGEGAGWETRLLEPGGPPILLDRLSVLVTGGASGRTVWLFRPDADPLLADDVTTALGGRRRDYVYGSLLPELGWLNPSSVGRSLGLDGWARAALATQDEPLGGPLAAGAVTDPAAAERYHHFAEAYCGTRAVTQPKDAAGAADRFARVCAPSPLDGVVECETTLQPELAIRLRHLLEILSLDPSFLPSSVKFRPAVASSFALLRGDSGEILAQSSFVPGRESSAYAPATAALERYLIAVREDRDPVTGARVRGEVGAEKADWSQPVAVGSVLKPLLAIALEWADPGASRALQLSAATRLGATTCAHGPPLLGHCPPTETLWEHPADAGVVGFLAQSYNWYQAAIGLLGTGMPVEEGAGGLFVLGDPERRALEDFSRLGALPPEKPLQTTWRGQPVIGTDGNRHALNVQVLRQTPMWKFFEAVVGRSLCPDPETCRARDDLCAARSLPLDAAELTADLEHLVTLGPRHFDFWPEYPEAKGKEKKRRKGEWVPIREYLQFLRGSGVHPIGSTLQVADAFNRLFFDQPSSGADPRYSRAASWFPSGDGAAYVPPPECKASAGAPSVVTGLCEALRSGTAKELQKTLRDDRIVFYGAKTGTIDSLGDVAETSTSCRAFNETHTPADGSTRYHLPDGGGGCPGKAPSDSLLAVAFGVRTPDGVVPLTLLLRFQGVRGERAGFAVLAAAPFLNVVADFFAGRPRK